MSDDENWKRLRAVIAQRIAETRTTQRAVSLAADLDENTVGNLVLGHVRSRPKTLRLIARALGWPEDLPERILAGEDPSGVSDLAAGLELIDATDYFESRVERPTIDFLSGHEDATAEQLLELLETVRHGLAPWDTNTLVEVVVTRALDELVEGTNWSVEGARPDWGADLVLVDDTGKGQVLVEAKSTPTQGFVSVDAPIGRASRMRARMSKAWEREVDYWVVFTTDPGPQVIAAFEEVSIPMGWVGHLPELPVES